MEYPGTQAAPRCGETQLEGVRKGTARSNCTRYRDAMSERNGDRARFQKNRKRKLRHRERIRALAAALAKHSHEDVSSRAASQGMLEEGGQLRAGD